MTLNDGLQSGGHPTVAGFLQACFRAADGGPGAEAAAAAAA